ncbi:MAG: type II toxin-antitoxin system prevent-host-death family antitoxin [Kineosporiaceae bacterium]
MSEASVRDLRNHGADVLRRVEAGEHVVITRDGRPVAELRPLARQGMSAAALHALFSALPDVDPQRHRDDVDAVLDQSW